MPSFDTVCEAKMVDVKHAVENTSKEITTRFDFKGTPAAIELKEKEITLIGNADFQLTQIEDILRNKLTKQNVDVRFLDKGDVQKMGGTRSKSSSKCVMALRQNWPKNPAHHQGQQNQGAGCHSGRQTARHRQRSRCPSGNPGIDPQGNLRYTAEL